MDPSNAQQRCNDIASKCSWDAHRCFSLSHGKVNPRDACESLQIAGDQVALESSCEWRGVQGRVEKYQVQSSGVCIPRRVSQAELMEAQMHADVRDTEDEVDVRRVGPAIVHRDHTKRTNKPIRREYLSLLSTHQSKTNTKSGAKRSTKKTESTKDKASNEDASDDDDDDDETAEDGKAQEGTTKGAAAWAAKVLATLKQYMLNMASCPLT